MSSEDKIVETESLIKQSLESFKSWLSKHSYIKFNGDENIDELLIHFLRIRNFSMDKTFKSFESSIAYIKAHPVWYANPGKADYEYTHNPDSPIKVMKNRDADGRIAWICKYQNYDNWEDSDKIVRSFMMTTLLLYFDPESARNGANVIFDLRDMTSKTFMKIPFSVHSDTSKAMNFGIYKVKNILFIGLPSFAAPFLDMVKAIISKKMADRLHIVTVEELSKYMDVSILPKEYGGSATELMNFETYEYGISLMNLVNKFDVDFNRIIGYENVGSFRKLEVD